MIFDSIKSQASYDLLYGLFQSERLLEGIGLFTIMGKIEKKLVFFRTQFASSALQTIIGPVIAKFGNNIIFSSHTEGDLGYLQTETHLVWLEPLSSSYILAFILPLEGKAVFLTENLKNTSQSLRYLLDKQSLSRNLV